MERTLTHSRADAGSAHFDEEHALHELSHYLPSQGALKDFIHHNSLHAYQHLKFYDAIFRASDIFGYQVTLQLDDYRRLYANGRIREEIIDRVLKERKGADKSDWWKRKMLQGDYDIRRQPRIGSVRSCWKSEFGLDMDYMVHPFLFRLLSSYLDQGIAVSRFPTDGQGFLTTLRTMEENGFVSLFRTERARKLFLSGEESVRALLEQVVGNEALFEQYLFDQQFSHHGWSGFVSVAENTPGTLLDPRKISLRELIVFELMLELDALEFHFGAGWQPLGSRVSPPSSGLFADSVRSELQEVLSLWQDTFEWSYYDSVLAGISQARVPERAPDKPFQALFCIDERECSLRRYVEQMVPGSETLGAPGFFGVEFYFQPEGGQFYEKLCPAPVTPAYLIKETGAKDLHSSDLLYHKRSHTVLGGALSALTLGYYAAVRTCQNLLMPRMSPAISDAYSHMDFHSTLSIENRHPDDRENGLQIGFTVEEMAARVEGLLRSIGAVRDFAPVFYIIAHGSSSANNPHHGAHDCGACSGRPGAVNARVFAFMANHAGVRAVLKNRGLEIPDTTQFVGAMHDTAADVIRYYDEQVLSQENRDRHEAYRQSFERALDMNARERSRRFASIDTRQSLKKVRRAILERSVSLFEPRPELGHGTNSLCIVGRRDMTRSLFLDRRAFLNSYDYRTDPGGTLLRGIMRPLGPVCGGINLEYYFSRVDNYKFGAGTKLPHNVVGLFAVANSSDGDLRPGLPLQMIEVHDPVRLLLIVEQLPDIVLRTVQSEASMYEWFINEWVHLIAVDPDSRAIYRFRGGIFELYQPVSGPVQRAENLAAVLENAPEMETNHIVDATRENLPVYTLNN